MAYMIEYVRVIRHEIRAASAKEAAEVAARVCQQFPKHDCKLLAIHPVADGALPAPLVA
jgi:hypothetical protein